MNPPKFGALTRRNLISQLGGLGLAGCLSATKHGSQHRPGSAPTILLRSSWQTENIGDIAHTPGLLALIQEHLPKARVILWPEAVDHGVGEMLHANFPGLEIIHGDVDAQGKPLDQGLRDAFTRADLLIHGSGSGMPGYRQVQSWKDNTGKPYVFFGISVWNISGGMKSLLDGAAHVFCRDTKSVANARAAVGNPGKVHFAPDAAFGARLRNPERASAYLKDRDLKSKQFLCVVPRLRQTPYEEIRRSEMTDAEVEARTEENQQFAEADHQKLRTVIERWVVNGNGKVLICPEMTYQLRLARPLLFDPLPASVKPFVEIKRTYWFPDEAASTYEAAAAVVSLEMHSPILAVMASTPAFYLRQPSDTIKGQMWKDIGLQDWHFEIDVDAGDTIADAVLSTRTSPDDAGRRLIRAQEFVRHEHASAMQRIAQTVGS